MKEIEVKQMPERDERVKKVEVKRLPERGVVREIGMDGRKFFVLAESRNFLLTEGFGPMKKRYCVFHRQHNCFSEVYFSSYAEAKKFWIERFEEDKK
jgi:hypothetical protein